MKNYPLDENHSPKIKKGKDGKYRFGRKLVFKFVLLANGNWLWMDKEGRIIVE